MNTLLQKIASNLEDQLLQNLSDTYASQGVNQQQVLDNPLFQSLPLEARVSYIENNPQLLRQRPTVNASRVAGVALGGGIAGLIGAAMIRATGGVAVHKMPLSTAGIALGAGALLSGVPTLLRAMEQNKKDLATARLSGVVGLGTNAIASRMGVQSYKSEEEENKYLTKAKEVLVPRFATQIGQIWK
jgi:hypothetical protein